MGKSLHSLPSDELAPQVQITAEQTAEHPSGQAQVLLLMPGLPRQVDKYCHPGDSAPQCQPQGLPSWTP